MPLQIHQFRCLRDNYAFLVRDEASGRVATIDTPDADAILSEAARIGWQIDLILNTHWHPDHAGGNAAIRAASGARIVAPEEVRQISEIDQVIAHGDTVMLGETGFDVIDVGGHTLGHIVFYNEPIRILFAGDTLFPMGCGRIFEGTPDQMWRSLSRLAALPADTIVYSAHEYALSNARFAVSVDASPATRQRLVEIEALTAAGRPSVPTTIAQERRTNPFLRAGILRPDAAGGEVAAFAELRAAKDVFAG